MPADGPIRSAQGWLVDPEERERQALLRLADFRGREVLDLGCGDGRTTRSIALTARGVLGVDPDVEAITFARRFATKGLSFEVADVASVDLPTAAFDTVVFSRSL